MSRAMGLLLFLVAAAPVMAQPSAAWTGWAQCQVNTAGPSYADQQTHTWVLTGAPPAMQGAFAIHEATWTAVGSGGTQRTVNSTPSQAQWTTNVTGVNAPLAISVRASDKRIIIRTWHDRLGLSTGIKGTEQARAAAVRPSAPTPLAFQAWESTFPTVEGEAGAVISGSSTLPTNGTTSPMQPVGSTRTTSCRWEFAQGRAVSQPPPPVMAGTTPPANSPTAPTGPPRSGTPAAATSAIPLINGDFEKGSLDGWAVFRTDWGTAGDVSVVPFDVDGDGTPSLAARFQTGVPSLLLMQSSPTEGRLEGGGPAQAFNAPAGTLRIRARVAATITIAGRPAPRPRFRVLLDNVLVAEVTFGYTTQSTVRGAVDVVVPNVAAGAHDLRFLIAPGGLVTPTVYEYIDDVTIEWSQPRSPSLQVVP